MKVGDLVKLSTYEEKTLRYEVDWKPEDLNDWEVGVIIEVCSDGRVRHHGNPPYYQVHWIPANEVIEESHKSITQLGKDESR